MKTKFTVILSLFLALAGCIEEELDKCLEGNVRVKIYAEKFQTNSPDATIDCEDTFNSRIQTLHCMLYKDSAFVMDTAITDVSATRGPFFEFTIPNLEFGDYHMVIIANCSPAAMRGDFRRRDGLSLLYIVGDKTDDLFGGTVDFTVDCDCTLEQATKLRRLLGVVRCRVHNVPENVTEAEITLHGVCSSLGKGGIYGDNIDVTRRVPIQELQDLSRAANSRGTEVTLGVFPPVTDQFAAFRLKLLSGTSDVPYFDKLVSSNVKIERNQLVELISDFSDGNFNFEIKLDSKWGDYVNGGGAEAN